MKKTGCFYLDFPSSFCTKETLNLEFRIVKAHFSPSRLNFSNIVEIDEINYKNGESNGNKRDAANLVFQRETSKLNNEL